MEQKTTHSQKFTGFPAPLKEGYNLITMEIELNTEYELYKVVKEKLLKEGREGKFVLIKGKTVVSFFDTEEGAYKEGVRRFGTAPFLIHKVSKEEPVESIQHLHVLLH